MILSVYLHREVVDILKMFGDLSDVINKMLDESDEGKFDIIDKPEAPTRDDASRYNIVITNENYLKMLQAFGIKSKKISLRRLIYWFIDNEMYDQLGWKQINKYVDKNTDKNNKIIDRIMNDLDKLELSLKYGTDMIPDIKAMVKSLRR